MTTSVIVRGAHDIVLGFAVDELVRYAAMISGESAVRGEPADGINIFLQVDPGLGSGDAFLLRSTPEGLVISSSASRGVLHGIYAYLESLGARFPFPGDDVIPHRPLVATGYDRRETPSFQRRGMTFSGSREHALGWIDFCGKQRLNWVFYHTFGSEAWWAENRDAVWPELQKRGMTLELGGHEMPGFIPRRLFREHPDWFRLSSGVRTNDYNFCPSSREAMEHLKERTRQYVRAMPEADVYNAWADDTAEDATTWCSCEQCRQYSPSDQNLLAMNAMAQAVRDCKPAAKIVHIAYHETIAPPVKVEPDPGIVMMWAPRERCYAHALNDPNCAKNRQHARWLENLLRVFDPAQAEVFEYYPDQYVFNHMMPALADTISGDLQYYHSLGIGLMEPLLTPFTHPWISPPTSAILQSKAEWDIHADLHGVLADYARTYFGQEKMVQYYEHRERALNRVIEACDFGHPVAAFWTPPIEQPEETARHLERLLPALDEVRLARQALAEAGRGADADHRQRLYNEEVAWNLASRHVNGQIHYARAVLAYDRYKKTGRREDALEAIRHFEHAYADLDEVYGRSEEWHHTLRVVERYIDRILTELG
jgi:hypothetical protein